MKIFSRILMVAALLAAVVTAPAQNSDTFNATRTVIVAGPTLLTAAVPIVTNGPIDLHGFYGIAKVDIFSFTNAGSTVTAQFYTSPDTTNLTTLANYASATATSVITTNANLGVGTNITATQTYLLPGTWTTPTAASAGFATSYLLPAPLTNSGAITVTAKNFYQIGFNAGDNARYLYVVWTASGGNTNGVVGATLTGRRGYEVR